MTATLEPRNTPKYQSDEIVAWKVKGSTKILKGTLVMAKAGYAKPGATETGAVALGRAEETVDNAGADGAATINVRPGVFRWANGDGIVQADVGKIAWIVDNQTVAKASTGKSKAGLIVAVDSLGVWVATLPYAIDLDSVEIAAVAADLEVVSALASAAPSFQAVAAGALSSGTLTINTGITVAANSEVIPILRGAITGSTNFGSLRELASSRVNGAPGVGTVVIEAVGADGAKDADAAASAGIIHVVILTPQ